MDRILAFSKKKNRPICVGIYVPEDKLLVRTVKQLSPDGLALPQSALRTLRDKGCERIMIKETGTGDRYYSNLSDWEESSVSVFNTGDKVIPKEDMERVEMLHG